MSHTSSLADLSFTVGAERGLLWIGSVGAHTEEFEIDVSMFDMSREFPPEPTVHGYARTRVIARPVMPDPMPRERAARSSNQGWEAPAVRDADDETTTELRREVSELTICDW